MCCDEWWVVGGIGFEVGGGEVTGLNIGAVYRVCRMRVGRWCALWIGQQGGNHHHHQHHHHHATTVCASYATTIGGVHGSAASIHAATDQRSKGPKQQVLAGYPHSWAEKTGTRHWHTEEAPTKPPHCGTKHNGNTV
jgi:hypothetical protein